MGRLAFGIVVIGVKWNGNWKNMGVNWKWGQSGWVVVLHHISKIWSFGLVESTPIIIVICYLVGCPVLAVIVSRLHSRCITNRIELVVRSIVLRKELSMMFAQFSWIKTIVWIVRSIVYIHIYAYVCIKVTKCECVSIHTPHHTPPKKAQQKKLLIIE